MLGATRVDDPKTYFDNLPRTEEFVFGNRFEFGSIWLEVISMLEQTHFRVEKKEQDAFKLYLQMLA